MTPAAGRGIGEGGVVAPRRLIPVLTAVACALVVATLVVVVARPDPASRPRTDAAEADPTTRTAGSARSRAAAVLAAWDERRSAAWAEGDVTALQELYADGAAAGAVDVRLLRDYLRRGLRVEGLTTQVLALRVAARSPERLEVVVTDRVVGAEAVGAGAPVALPVARPSTRRVVLVRDAEGERWVVAVVRDQDSAAASTSRTSSSSKS